MVGGFLEIAAAADLNFTTSFTAMAWVNPQVRGSMRIIDKGASGANDAYMIDTHPEGNLRVITRAFGFQMDLALPTNAWSHVALTFGSGTARVYLNGKVIGAQTNLTGQVNATDLPLHVGADSSGGSVFRGAIDDVMLWRRALTAEEIAKWAGL